MAKTRVPVAGTIGKSIKTISATPPQNLTITPAQIQAIIAAVNASQLAANPSGAAPTFWQLISEIPQNIVDIAALISSGYLVRNPDGTWALVPPSPPGQPGLDGEPGEDGERGVPGAPGKDGLTVMGPPGIDGEDGMDGAMGPPGPQGPAGSGATGAQGPMGNPGQDGSDGADGDQGPPGLLGPQGPTGTTGGQGPMGNPGVAGDDGVDGDVGPPGQIGPQGPTGTTGATGSAGQQGVMGVPNPMEGPQGEDGIMGPQGPQGPAGATGAPGAIGSATYQITFGDESGGGGEDPRPFFDTGASPTWAGQHIFAGSVLSGTQYPVWAQGATATGYAWKSTGAATDSKTWDALINGTDWLLRTVNDAGSNSHNALDFTRSGLGLTAMAFGNATDSPTFNFLGTGTATFHGFVDTDGDTTGAFRARNTAGTFAGQVGTDKAWGGGALSATDFAVGSAGLLHFYTNNSSTPSLTIDTSNVATFNGQVTSALAGGASGAAFYANSAGPAFGWRNSSGATDGKLWDFTGDSATTLTLRTVNDALSAAQNVFRATRSGVGVADISFGNATGNPTFSFLGTGTATFNGHIVESASSPVLSMQDTGANGARLDIGAANTKTTLNFSANIVSVPGAIQMLGTDVIGISTARNVTISAPSSGATLALSGPTSTAQQTWSDGTRNASIFFTATNVQLGTSSAHDFALFANNTIRATVTSAGAFNINTVGQGLGVASGTNAKVGSGTLGVSGQVTIANTSVTANSLIFATYVSGPGGPLTTALSVTSQTAGTGFVAAGTPSAPFIYMIVEKI